MAFDSRILLFVLLYSSHVLAKVFFGVQYFELILYLLLQNNKRSVFKTNCSLKFVCMSFKANIAVHPGISAATLRVLYSMRTLTPKLSH